MFKVGQKVKVKKSVIVMPGAKGTVKELLQNSCKVDIDTCPFPVLYKYSELEKDDEE